MICAAKTFYVTDQKGIGARARKAYVARTDNPDNEQS